MIYIETACEYLDDKVMRVYTDERRMITKLLKIAKEHPNEVEIIRLPEENDGCLYFKCPASYLKISPPVKRIMTDEQRIAATERLKSARKMKQSDLNK